LRLKVLPVENQWAVIRGLRLTAVVVVVAVVDLIKEEIL